GWFCAVHVATQHPVLLQFIEPRVSADPAAWNRAQSLAKQFATVESPNVLELYELVDAGQHKFFVFDDRGRQTVAQRIAREQRLAAGAACRLANDVANGLSTIHAAGLVHGRVRPDNILIGPGGAGVLLFDPLAGPEPLAIGGAAGTDDPNVAADYAAPELAAAGIQPTPLTDVYALGATLYEMVAGRPPFADGDVQAKLNRHATERIVPLEQVAGAPSALTNVVAYAMAKDASIRYADANTFSAAIAQFSDPSATTPMRQNAVNFRQALGQRRAAFVSSSHLPADRAAVMAAIPASAAGAMRAVPAEQVATNGGPASHETTANIAPNAAAAAPAPATLGAAAPAAAKAVESSAIPIARPVEQRPGPGAVEAPVDRQEKVREAARRRKITQYATIGASLLFATVLAGYLLTREVDDPSKTSSDDKVAKRNDEDDDPKRRAVEEDDAPATEGGRQGTVEDDGRTLWAPPTVGKPIDLRYVPSGAHAYLYVRPRSLFESIDGRRAYDALGAPAMWLRAQVKAAAGVSLDQIDRLTVALNGTPGGWPTASMVVEMRQPRSGWLKDLGDPAAVEHGDQTYYRGDGWAYYFPNTKPNRILVAAPEDEIKAIIDERDRPAVLRRLEMRKLLAASDSRQHVTLLTEPNFLFGDGREMFAEHARKLIDPLRAYVTRDLNGLMLGVFANDQDFYLDVRMAPGSRKSAYTIQKEFNERFAGMADEIQDYVSTLDAASYGKALVDRLPEMVRRAIHWTRTGVLDGQFVVRTYLPSAGGHNLILATELALAETPGGAVTPTGPAKPTTLAEQLRMPLTLVFDQMAFGAVVKELMDQSGATIVVLGKDIEADGITRNKEIRDFNMTNKSLHDMLVLLCMKNNPVPGLTSAADANQKLVYVVGPSPDDGKDVILITTRKAAGTKGYKLPAAFGG
ncbi:MAG: protein kinase, partial [Pirellulales bacterium]|nr:protein kinase [Pirellulales bacterium]